MVVLCFLESTFHSPGLDLRQIHVLWRMSLSVLLNSDSGFLSQKTALGPVVFLKNVHASLLITSVQVLKA